MPKTRFGVLALVLIGIALLTVSLQQQPDTARKKRRVWHPGSHQQSNRPANQSRVDQDQVWRVARTGSRPSARPHGLDPTEGWLPKTSVILSETSVPKARYPARRAKNERITNCPGLILVPAATGMTMMHMCHSIAQLGPHLTKFALITFVGMGLILFQKVLLEGSITMCFKTP